MSRNGQPHFKNLAAFAARFLKKKKARPMFLSYRSLVWNHSKITSRITFEP